MKHLQPKTRRFDKSGLIPMNSSYGVLLSGLAEVEIRFRMYVAVCQALPQYSFPNLVGTVKGPMRSPWIISPFFLAWCSEILNGEDLSFDFRQISQVVAWERFSCL